MRSAFEAWAQRDGHIVRRREDKPEEYLVYETQRRWVIWQAALAHGAKTADAAPSKFAGAEAPPRPSSRTRRQYATACSTKCSMRSATSTKAPASKAS
jgi:hypothetical protein